MTPSGKHEPDGAPKAGTPEPDEWRARREQLARRLEAQRRAMPAESRPPNTSGGFTGVAQGLKIASEFVAGILVGAGLGYLLDLFAGTGPFGLIVFLMIGFAAGVLNVLRSVGRTGSPPPAP